MTPDTTRLQFLTGLESSRRTLTETKQTPQTGGDGLLRNLPDGWVNVTEFVKDYTDIHECFNGPVLNETPTVIVIESYGEPRAWLKSRVMIQRSDLDS